MRYKKKRIKRDLTLTERTEGKTNTRPDVNGPLFAADDGAIPPDKCRPTNETGPVSTD